MSSTNLFWDSCVFIRYFSGDTTLPYFSDICRYVEDAKAGKRTIHFSSLTLAEFRQQHFRESEFGTLQEFLEDMGTACVMIEPNPNVMMACSELRSVTPTDPGRPHTPASRVLSTPDAIVLSCAVFAKEAMGIDDLVLHSTDEGKGKNWAGKCIPIIGFDRWYPSSSRTAVVQSVCDLERSLPLHPEPQLEGIVIHGRFDAGQGDKG